MNTPHKPKLVIVSGSTRPTSMTRTVLKLAQVLAAKRGFDTEFICARELGLPIFGMESEEHMPNVTRWRTEVQNAAGVIFGSPEYHGTFSGVLKNMIDYLDFPHIKGKPTGLIAVGGGAKSGIGTLNALRIMFRALHVPVIVEQAAVYEGDFLPETQQPRPELLKQILGVVDGLSREVARCAPQI